VEIERLQAELEQWLEHRTASDTSNGLYAGRHLSQLGAVTTQVRDAAERLRAICEADAVSSRPIGQVFREYALHDQRLIWVRYAWSYFREKLDQRDDPNLQKTLEAADEVSWACHASFFGEARLERPAPPMPYIEYDYVPSALRTSHVHVLPRRPGVDAGPLKEYFAALPVALLRLPPAVVTAPWALLLIGHEIGHLIAQYFEPDYGPAGFAELVVAQVTQAGADQDRQKKWRAWSQEVFADMCLAIVAGPWSVWAFAPWVMTDGAAMTEDLDRYPAPQTRLQLLEQMAVQAHHGDASAIFDRLAVGRVKDAEVDAVAQLVNRQFSIAGRKLTLAAALGGPTSRQAIPERIGRWAKQLAGGKLPAADVDRTSARDAVVAATRAHFEVADDSAKVSALRGNVEALVSSSREPGTRAGSTEPDFGSLADALFNLPDEALFLADAAHAPSNAQSA